MERKVSGHQLIFEIKLEQCIFIGKQESWLQQSQYWELRWLHSALLWGVGGAKNQGCIEYFVPMS